MILVGLFVNVAAALALACTVAAQNTETNIVPGAYLVEFETSALGARSLDPLSFYTNLSDNNIAAEPRVDLNHELFKGASFRLETKDDNPATIDTIRSFQAVKKIWPVRVYYHPAEVLTTFENAPNLPTSLSGSINSKRSASDSYIPHVLGGVDKLHDEGFTGEGIFIAVIDGGVDYTHPALGGCLGPGCKIVMGTDLVGDDYTGYEVPVPDDDPMDCWGHGTHVSGIIGANPNSYNFTGVAPDATLGMWKVNGCTGGAGVDVLIQALNLAYEANPDIISMSIGSPIGWAEDPVNIAVQRIVEKGVPCIFSAGNEGYYGPFYSGSPADAIGAVSVGSIDNTVVPRVVKGALYTVNDTGPMEFQYAGGTSNGEFGNLTVQLYALTLNTTVEEDGCNALPDDTPDLANYAVLIRRGVCNFDDKVANAAAKGAKRILIYTNDEFDIFPPQATSRTEAVGMISAKLGETFIEALKSGINVDITFQGSNMIYSVIPNTFTPGKMSPFSSWGPTFELHLKPEVAAPGGVILSTWPWAKGGYAVLSGTSMAAPFIASTIALIKQIRGKNTFSPSDFTALLASTASPVDFNDGFVSADYLAPIVQQGGGLVNAHKAAHINTFLDKANIPLNDSWYFKSPHPLSIKNIGSEAQTYTFSNLIAATVFTFSNGSIVPDVFPPNLAVDAASGATIRFKPESLTVAPGKTGIVTMHFNPPKGLDASRIPIYSGYVGINGSNGDALTLPYAGIASRMKDAQVLNTAAGYPFLTSSIDTTEAIPGNGTVFTIPGNITSTDLNPNFTYPTIMYDLAMGSRLVRLDIIPDKRQNLTLALIAGQSVLGPMLWSPVEFWPRNLPVQMTWDGVLSDGRRVPAGMYKVMVRALKITGDAEVDSDYERWDSPVFEIRYV